MKIILASFSFLVFQFSNNPKQTSKGPSKHLEAKEIRSNTQNSIREGQKTDLTSDSFVYDATLPPEDSGLMPTPQL